AGPVRWALLGLLGLAALPAARGGEKEAEAARQRVASLPLRLHGGSLSAYPLDGVRGLSVSLASNNDFTDDDLAALKGIPNVGRLDLGYTLTSDKGVAHLAGLTTLRELVLARTDVTDEGARHLKGMTRLRELVLDLTAVGDKGLGQLRGLTELEALSL